jgi:hypothetical protein
MSDASDERRAANCWAIPVLILSIIHIILVFVEDLVSFWVGVIGTVTSSIVVCGCLPTTGSSGCGYRAAKILGIITSFLFFANLILHILWWAVWAPREPELHIVGTIFLVIKIASLGCTVALTQKLFKAHAAALRDESSRQPSVIIGSVVEMTPAHEKA